MKTNSEITIEKLFIGTPKKEDFFPVETAIKKEEVSSLTVEQDRIIGDMVANLKHHGGDNRVLHQYAIENYDLWNKELGHNDFVSGCLGENISAYGMTEQSVCVGNVYQIGEVQCVVTEPRKPCGTINRRMDVKGLAKKIQETCRTGWFYRILIPGKINQGDNIKLIERPYPNLTISNCVEALLLNRNPEVLKEMSMNPILSDNWKTPSLKLLETGQMKDDGPRLK